MADTTRDKGIGGRIAPPRFIAFIAAFVIAVAVGVATSGWRRGVMGGFDIAALLFFILIWPLVRSAPDEVRKAARRNDANRALLLVITGIVMVAVLVSVAAELGQKGKPEMVTVGKNSPMS